MHEYDRLFIGNEWVTPATDRVLEVRSPATLDVVGRAPEASTDDMDRAVTAARDAFDEGPWPAMTFAERAAYLDRIHDALRPHGEALDQLVPQESGIPVCFASGSSGFALFDYYSELGRNYSQESVRPGRVGVVGGAIIRQAPAGVVAGIVPWNGPVMQILMKLAPALLAGCTIVIKPSPETPLSAFTVAAAVEEAGLPRGVVSIVPAGREAGAHLVAHPGVDRVSFTGSTAAGKQIAAECGKSIRRVSLELGGKSPAILLDELDLDTAIPTVVSMGMFFNGEACSAFTRLLVSRGRHDEVVDRVVEFVSSLPVGDPLDPNTFFGPLVSATQRDRVERYIAGGLEEGASLAHGGGRPAGLDVGWYVEPTVFTDVKNSMRVAQEEIFGPVLSVIPYDSVDEAVHIANESQLGLAGGVFADDEYEALAVARRLRTGHVGINGLGMDWVLPFGGFKQSGTGREMGIEGLELYCELQTIGFNEGSPLGGSLKLVLDTGARPLGMACCTPDPPSESPFRTRRTMNRRDLVAALAERTDTDKRSADAALQAFIDTITETVATGEVVMISGFVKFARVDRPARMGRNPGTGEAIKIKASRRARVTPLKAFKDAVLAGKAPAKKAPARKTAAKKTAARKR